MSEPRSGDKAFGLNIPYLNSKRGLLNILEMVFSLATVISAIVATSWLRAGYLQMAATSALHTTTSLLVGNLIGIDKCFGTKLWDRISTAFCLVYFILLLLLGTLGAVYSDEYDKGILIAYLNKISLVSLRNMNYNDVTSGLEFQNDNNSVLAASIISCVTAAVYFADAVYRYTQNSSPTEQRRTQDIAE